jgi:hypothetical protein
VECRRDERAVAARIGKSLEVVGAADPTTCQQHDARRDGSHL